MPAFASSITWKRKGIYDVSVAMMQRKVENEGDAWTWANAKLADSFQNIISKKTKGESIPPLKLFKSRSFEGTPQIVKEAIGSELLHGVKMMAIRTAEMHEEEFTHTVEDDLIEAMKTIPAKELYSYIINYAKRHRSFREDFFEEFG